MKVADLTGAKLNFWAAKADGKQAHIVTYDVGIEECCVRQQFLREVGYHPSTDWAQAGPLIENNGIAVVKFYKPIDGPIKPGHEWAALSLDDKFRMDGPTPLIAAMRCFVASKFGEEVE